MEPRRPGRSETQSVEIVAAVLLGVLTCAAVLAGALISRLTGPFDGAWAISTRTIGIGAGIGVTLWWLLRAARSGL